MYRRKRTLAIGYLALALCLFIGLVLLIRLSTSLAVDLDITRFLQSFRSPSLDLFMELVGLPGYFPQTIILNAIFVLILYLCRMRLGALTLVVVGSLVGISGTALRYTIDRPRPTADLVWVAQKIEEGHYSFPSGHVVGFTAILGFIMYLGFTELEPSWHRNILLFLYALYIGLVGISRVYVGEHWASDVLASYLYGSCCLVVMIFFYRWVRSRYVEGPNKQNV